MNLIFFTILLWDWAHSVHQSPQLSRALARLGHRVLFVQPPRLVSGEPPASPIQLVTLSDLGLSETRVARAWFGLDAGPLETVANNLLSKLEAFEVPGAPRVAVWFAPFEPFARLLPVLRARGYHIIYYPYDDFSDMQRLGFYRTNLQAHEYLGQQAECVVTLSEPVADKMCRFGKPVTVVPDGINLEEFQIAERARSAPPDLLRGRYTLGFWGWISDAMVDAEMLACVARAHPDWAINLIGDVQESANQPPWRERLHFPNIRFHGHFVHDRLKEYGRFFDLGLIPAPPTDFSRGRDPLKVYEYLALHKPVVATHMSQLSGMPFVYNASTPAEFLAQIETALQTPVDPQAIDAFLAEQTWDARAEAFVQVVNQLLARENASLPAPAGTAAAGTLVAPSFIDEGPGLRAYLDAVESDLAQTRQWAKDLQAMVLSKDQELSRIYNFPPVRLARILRRMLRPH